MQISLDSKQKFSLVKQTVMFVGKNENISVFDGGHFRSSIYFSDEMKRALGLPSRFPLELTSNSKPNLSIPPVSFWTKAHSLSSPSVSMMKLNYSHTQLNHQMKTYPRYSLIILKNPSEESERFKSNKEVSMPCEDQNATHCHIWIIVIWQEDIGVQHINHVIQNIEFQSFSLWYFIIYHVMTHIYSSRILAQRKVKLIN